LFTQEIERINFMKEYRQNQEVLFSKQNTKEVTIMGELLTMNVKVNKVLIISNNNYSFIKIKKKFKERS
jgi:hypothetical protein